MSVSVGKAVYNILSSDASVSTIVSNKIYPAISRQGDTAPYVRYTVVNSIPHETKTSSSKVDFVRVQIDAFADNYEELESLSAAIRGAIDRAPHGTYSGVSVSGVKLLSEEDLFNDIDGIFGRMQDYRMRIDR